MPPTKRSKIHRLLWEFLDASSWHFSVCPHEETWHPMVGCCCFGGFDLGLIRRKKWSIEKRRPAKGSRDRFFFVPIHFLKVFFCCALWFFLGGYSLGPELKGWLWWGWPGHLGVWFSQFGWMVVGWSRIHARPLGDIGCTNSWVSTRLWSGHVWGTKILKGIGGGCYKVEPLRSLWIELCRVTLLL